MSPVDERVTVVIPARNAAAFIHRAIESALAQGPQVTQVVVVDDASTDATSAVVSAMADRRITLLTGRGIGPSAARNDGAAIATSRWLAFLDADDYWLPSKIPAQLAALARSGDRVAYTGIVWQDEGTDSGVRHEPRLLGDVRRQLLLGNRILGSNSGVIVERDLFRAVGGYNEALTHAEDWDLWLRLADRTEFTAVAEPLVVLIARSGSHGRNVERTVAGSKVVLDQAWRRQHAGILMRAHSLSEVYARAAMDYELAGKIRASAKYAALAALTWPCDLRTCWRAIRMARMALTGT